MSRFARLLCIYRVSLYCISKEKVKPFEHFRKNKEVESGFALLINPAEVVDTKNMDIIQEYACTLCTVKKYTCVYQARLQFFQKNFATKSATQNFIKKVLTFESNLLPPCWKSVKQ